MTSFTMRAFCLSSAHSSGLATPEECAELKQKALIVNEVMIDFFKRCNLKLVDFKIEFGRTKDSEAKIVLADEISPDTCRLWDIETGKKLDKDRFRQDLGDVMGAYEEVLKRVENEIS